MLRGFGGAALRASRVIRAAKFGKADLCESAVVYLNIEFIIIKDILQCFA